MSFGGVDEKKLVEAAREQLTLALPEWIAQLKEAVDKLLSETDVKVTITFERTPKPQ